MGSSGEPGISCSGLSGSWTSCLIYGLGSAYGDSATYATTTALDPNNHKAVGFTDALGRSRYSQQYSGTGSGATTITTQQQTQYNVLNKPTSVIVTDQAPQSGQSITQVTTTASYDDLGRLTGISDPDRGSHTLTYDADGRLVTDVSGSRTLGYSLDLLGRIGCVQDATVTPDPAGACTSGANPFVKNTYDSDPSGVSWGSTNYAVGQLTQSVATTYYPSPDYTQGNVTENFQYDQRGRSITQRLQVAATGGNLTFPTFPLYQETQSYNDANQPTTTQTTVGGSAGYTFTQAYDSTTGTLTGLSNNTTGTANLATLSTNAQAELSSVNYLTSTGSALASDAFTYDGNRRPTGATATWQSGSGNSGTIYSDTASYDPASNVISRSTTQAAVPGQSGSGGSETQNFCYDEQNRLVWSGNSGTQPGAGNGTCGSGTLSNSISGASYTNSFAYTNLGQLWQGPLSGGSTQYQYLYCDSSHPHQLTGLYPTGTACSGRTGSVYTSSYDSWGNVTSRSAYGTTSALSFDGLDHFVRWDVSSTNEEWYMYDGSGQRVLRRTTNSSGTTFTVYAFGLEEHVYDTSGTNLWNNYYYTLGGRLLGNLDGNGTHFFLTDTLGSVVSSINNTSGGAAIKGNQVFGPYGNARYSSGTLGTSKGYTGQYNDGLTGLDYYNARYYDPVVGRFLSADTVQGNLQGMDPYAYVGGDPETKDGSDRVVHGWGQW